MVIPACKTFTEGIWAAAKSIVEHDAPQSGYGCFSTQRLQIRAHKAVGDGGNVFATSHLPPEACPGCGFPVPSRPRD